MDNAEYCRQIESYLCQKNGGHLIRIVGPAFEQVCGWAEQGIPLKIACGGIDRYCERQQARTTRRRPVRIEFCEADILALFDDWRRAVGVAHTSAEDPAAQTVRKPSLAAHLERIAARLVGRRTPRSAPFERHLEGLLVELDALSAASRHARGAARAEIVERLATLDREMMSAAMADVDAATLAAFAAEAEHELAPFGSRMPADARGQAREAAVQRLVRESLALPTIRYA